MKKLIVILLLNFILITCSYSQTGWVTSTSGTNNVLQNVYFPSANTGYAIGWSGEILKTTNQGLNWNEINFYNSTGLQGLYFINDNTGWISGNSGLIANTTNGGGSWTIQSSGMGGDIYYSIKFLNVNTGICVGYSGIILRTTNSGINWYNVSYTSYSTLTSVFFIDNQTGWVSGDYGTIYKSTNGGLNWFSLQSGVTNNLGKLYFVDQNTGWVSGTSGLILKTTNGGVNWIAQQSNLNSWLISPTFVSANTGWISGDNGVIIKTTNGGLNWFQQISGTAQNLRGNYFINSNTGFIVGFNGTILKTTTGGDAGLTAPILIYPPNNMVGVNYTPTMTWTPVSTATYYKVQISTINNFVILTDSTTTSTPYYTIPFGKLQNYITYYWRVKAGNSTNSSDWSSVFQFTVWYDGITQNGTSVPTSFNLYQNHPNPFNPSTKIKFDVPQASNVKVSVFDITGKEIQQILNGKINAGSFEYTWDAGKFNSGIYFVRMQSDNFTSTIKMSLIK